MVKKAKASALALAAACALWAPGVMAQQAGDAPDTEGNPGKVIVEDDPVPVVGDPTEKDLAKVKERLTFMLSGYEYFPDRDELDKLAGPEVIAPMLLEMARDQKTRPLHRLRAVDALGYYSDDATRDWLRGVAVSPVVTKKDMTKGELRFAGSLRHHAIMSLAKAGEAKELATLERLLAEDSDLQIRLTVVSAIGKHTGKDGKALLAKVQAQETNPVMQRELRKHL